MTESFKNDLIENLNIIGLSISYVAYNKGTEPIKPIEEAQTDWTLKSG